MSTHILHTYDHCPFCIRVELAMGLTNKPYSRVLYGYGDRLGDESKKSNTYDGGVVLTGKKELPVLEERVDEERTWLKNESLDILDWIQAGSEPEQRWNEPSGREVENTRPVVATTSCSLCTPLFSNFSTLSVLSLSLSLLPGSESFLRLQRPLQSGPASPLPAQDPHHDPYQR